MENPHLPGNRITAVESTINDITAETSTGCSSARKNGRLLDVPNSSIRRILQGILHLSLETTATAEATTGRHS